MRRISNKEITTDFFGGKNCNTYGRKNEQQSNFLDLQRTQTNVIVANKFRSFKQAKNQTYAFNKKKWTMTKEGP